MRNAPLVIAAVLAAACGGEGTAPIAEPVTDETPAEETPVATPTIEVADLEISLDDVPISMRPCHGCHQDVVNTYLTSHGMARSIGPIGEPPTGTVTNPKSGNRYEIVSAGGEHWLNATFPDGGRRAQRLVGRIGAGIFDISWVGEEVDVLTDERSGRLYFAPIETVTGHGNELSPFELSEPAAGLDLALDEGCLTCHTDSNLARLSGAGVGPGAPDARRILPSNALGGSAFAELEALNCQTCHGDAGAHIERMNEGFTEGFQGDLEIDSLGDLPAGSQRDVCARCHLQGDARIDLVGDELRRDVPLAGQIPMLVPERPDDDFRFVSQLERLVLSPCFQGVDDMTCSTCHDAHRGVAAQGLASFDATCAQCHDCSRDPALAVEEVTGEPARTEAACVDCHVRRSQPFDLPHVRSADHFIRRRPPPPEELPHRQFADPDGALRIFDDGRLAATLATPEGKRWQSGVLAMGLLTLGRVDEAIRHFDELPPPGSDDARRRGGPAELASVEERTAFHQTRAFALMASGRFEAAVAAFSDALEIDPLDPGSLVGRARLFFDTGFVGGAVQDSQTLIDAYPRAEHPYQLRVAMAERLGRPDLALEALEESTRRWPSDATSWYKLGLLLEQSGEAERARSAYERAKVLQPSLSLPGAGPISAR